VAAKLLKKSQTSDNKLMQITTLGRKGHQQYRNREKIKKFYKKC